MNNEISNSLFQNEKKDDINRIEKLIEKISKYNTVDFLKSVSALMLFPQNQSKSVIFSSMINAALSLPEKNSTLPNKMNITTFKQIVEGFEQLSISNMVDPPEFPYILPVLYFDNPYVFMGNNTLSPIYLSNYLKVLEINKEKIRYDRYKQLKSVINGLLKISSNIVNKINLKMENLIFYPMEEKIFIPNKKTLDVYKQIITLTEEEINNIFKDSINEYTSVFESMTPKKTINIKYLDILYKPFIKHNKEYVILDITSFLSLIFRVLLKETHLLKNINFIEEYNKLNSLELKKRFFSMGCKEIEIPNIDLIKSNEYEENLLIIGNDSIIISIQLFDKGDKLFFNNKNSAVTFSKEDRFISRRISFIKNKLIINNINENKIFTIITPYALGRDFIYSLLGCKTNDILILTLYELSAIAVNEGENKLFLQEYINARKKLKYYGKSSFSELNIIAMFVKNNYSFYINDDVDIKETYPYFIGEYSSDYILKSYQKESKQLCEFYKKNTFIEVINYYDKIFFAPQLFLNNILNKVVIDNKSTIWIISENNIEKKYNTFQWISDVISYWLNEILPLSKNNKYNILLKLNIDEHLSKGIEQIKIDNSIDKIVNLHIHQNFIEIDITNELCNYFNCKTNNKEKEFIGYLLHIFQQQYNINFSHKRLEEVFSNPYKRKTININSVENAYMVPSNKDYRAKVSSIFKNIILDNIGLYFHNKKDIKYGKIENKKICNYIVEILYKKLINDLSQYNKHDLIFYLYQMYENNLGNLLIRQNFYINDIACYPENKSEIDNNINDMNQLSVAVKFLIELCSSFISNNNLKISFYDIDYDIAIAAEIIEWAYVGDLLYYKMLDSDIHMLESNRIGFDKTALNKINSLIKNAVNEKNSIYVSEQLKSLEKFSSKEVNNKNDFEEAFIDEFGYTFNDYIEIVTSLLKMFKMNYNELLEVTVGDVKHNIQNPIEYSSIKKIMDSLSLTEREDFLKPPKPYVKEDVFPWRFNRQLSFSRRPLVKINDRYVVGYRTLINSVIFFLNLINEGKYHAHSKKMKDYISKKNNLKGKRFNDQVYNYLLSFDSLIVKKNVKKINKKHISDENNNFLGDIDVLYISKKHKIIGIIETKNFDMARNFYEISNEYKKMFDSNNSKSLYKKHKHRVNWIVNHIDDIIEEYKLPKYKWKIKDMFIVDDYVISKSAYDIDVNLYTLSELTEEKLYN